MNKAFLLKAVFFLLFVTSQFSLKAQTSGSDTVKKDTVSKDAFKKDTLKSDSLKKDTIKKDTLKKDTINKDSTITAVNRPRLIFLELGGPGLALTLNYDTRLGHTRDKWGYRVGMGYYNTGSNWVFSIPLQVNYLYGSGNDFFEGGIGTTFVKSHGTTTGTTFQFDNVTGFIGTLTIGYRYQAEEGGLNFRIAFVPILYDEGLVPAGGISLGYTF
jgi:pentapeptide MXKDX repeat protein